MPSVPYSSPKVSCRATEIEIRTSSSGEVNQSLSVINYGSYSHEEREKYWENTPNYHAKVKAKEALPDRVFYYTKARRDVSNGFYCQRFIPQGGLQSVRRTRTYPFHVKCESADSFSGPLGSNSPLASKILERAKSHEWQAPVFVAEAAKTAVMVFERARTLKNMAVSLRRGDFAYFLDSLQITHEERERRRKRSTRVFNENFGRDAHNTASSAWLEFAYGWTPFMLDVKNALNTVMDMVELQGAKRIGRVTARQSWSKTQSRTLTLEGSPNIECIQTQTVTESRRMVWRFETLPEDLPGRFGLTNPLDIVWELVPFSFVADWFLPIGDYISALDAPIRFTHRGGCVGLKRQVITRYHSPFSNGDWDTVKGGGTATYVIVTRTPLGEIPTPSLEDFAVGFPTSVQRALSSVALLRQVMLGFQPPTRHLRF